MKKERMKKPDYNPDWKWILAVFCMDYYSSQWSRGYRIACRLKPNFLSNSLMDSFRNSDLYDYLVENYSDSV